MRVLRERGLAGCFAIFMALLVVMVAVVPENAFAAAFETRYEMRSGDLTFGNDFINTGLGETVFHQQTLACLDHETTGITFPAELEFNDAGEPAVDLALPSITQTSFQSYSYTNTGFFNANLPFYPCCNYGAAPVGVGQFGKPSPVSLARFEGSGLLYPQMVNEGNLAYRGNTSLYTDTNINNTRITLPPPNALQPTAIVAAIGNRTVGGSSNDPLYNTSDRRSNKSNLSDYLENGYGGNIAGTNNTGGKNAGTYQTGSNIASPLILSSLRFNINAPASQINNTSIVERMWRNSHTGRLLDFAYEGDASYPTWIAPGNSIKDFTQRRDPRKIIGYSLNMTKPGEYITHSFWDL